jgi:hypothetical protein
MKSSPHDTGLHMHYRARRAEELARIVSHLPSLRGKHVVSLGCGTAPEIDVLDFASYVGVDHRPWLVPLWNTLTTARVQFASTSSFTFLNAPRRIDALLCLDIDTQLFPVETIDQASTHISPGGIIVFAERAGNPEIYGRQLLLPFINEIKERFGSKYAIQYVETASERDKHLLLLAKSP